MVLVVFLMQSWLSCVDSSLVYVGLTRYDMSFRTDYTIRDPYRFEIIDDLLKDPFHTIDFLTDLDLDFWLAEDKQMLDNLVEIFGFEIADHQVGFEEALALSDELVDRAFDSTPIEILDVFEELTLFSPELTTSIEEDRRKMFIDDSLVGYLKDHALLIDYQRLFSASMYLLMAADNYQVWLQDLDLHPREIPGVDGMVLFYKQSDFGEIVVGDTGVNTYKKRFNVIIDCGGDDRYFFMENEDRYHLIIDESGDDRYEGQDYAIACGRFGVSLIIDQQGDDYYGARNFSIGCGIFGVGMLIDKAGFDTYYGDTFTEGAAGFGIGILKDCEGNDIHQGALHAQGFASTYGIGILANQGGNDQYIITEKYIDEIRYLDHYLSCSQGFSIGFRPDLSAGIGVILEAGGNDYYLGDIFAQASSYWYGLGAIVDAMGNDTYVAYQYAQGAGTHITIGALIDWAGDDNYIAKGVSQGCGHDLSLGMLYDKNGDDSYLAFDLSQGAGNANGIGILLDENGDDSYSVKRQRNTQGYGNFRREYGSIGMLVDIQGNDSYNEGGNTLLWKKGQYGIGIDWE